VYLNNFEAKDKICEFTISLSKSYSDSYKKSCNFSELESSHIHPTELSTLALKEYIKRYPIPTGSIHMSQEIEVLNKIPYNSILLCEVILESSKKIKDRKIVVLTTNARNKKSKIVAVSKGTLMVPLS
tara:strand:+ start:457 stop:840 length:384 start_codon:yes stop_codon:yes gene_type:complete